MTVNNLKVITFKFIRMELRYASINDLPIRESERKFFWELGRRPDEHESLSDFGCKYLLLWAS